MLLSWQFHVDLCQSIAPAIGVERVKQWRQVYKIVNIQELL